MKATVRAISKLGTWTLFSLSMGALMVKIVAIVLGPAGVGVLSLLRQAQQTFTSIGTFNGDTALVQGLASREGAEKEKYLVTVAKLFLINALIAGVGFILLLPFLRDWIFHDANSSTSDIFDWILLPALFSCANVLLLGVLNSYRAVGRMAASQAVSALMGALLAYPLTKFGNQSSLIILLSVISITNFGMSLYFLLRAGWLKPLFHNLFVALQREYVAHFFSISWVALVVGFSGAGSLLLIRLAIVQNFGIASAGVFDAAWTLSSMYLLVFLSSFGTHFLPEMSSELDPELFKQKIYQMMQLSILVSIAIILPVVLAKGFIVTTLYSKDFSSSLDMIRWMLIGDYFKVTVWVLSLPLLARAHMKAYLYLSLTWNVLFVIAAMISIKAIGAIEYIGAAYLFTQIIYLLLALQYWRGHHRLIFSHKLILLWLLGVLMIISSSAIYWNSANASIIAMFVWFFTVVLFVWYGIGSKVRVGIKKYAYEKLLH